MQVRILPAAPLPGGVKVARRFVKPHGVGASPTLAAILNAECRMKNAECRFSELSTFCILHSAFSIQIALTIADGWQSSNAPVPKTERASGLRGCNPYTIRHFNP